MVSERLYWHWTLHHHRRSPQHATDRRSMHLSRENYMFRFRPSCDVATIRQTLNCTNFCDDGDNGCEAYCAYRTTLFDVTTTYPIHVCTAYDVSDNKSDVDVNANACDDVVVDNDRCWCPAYLNDNSTMYSNHRNACDVVPNDQHLNDATMFRWSNNNSIQHQTWRRCANYSHNTFVAWSHTMANDRS